MLSGKHSVFYLAGLSLQQRPQYTWNLWQVDFHFELTQAQSVARREQRGTISGYQRFINPTSIAAAHILESQAAFSTFDHRVLS